MAILKHLAAWAPAIALMWFSLSFSRRELASRLPWRAFLAGIVGTFLLFFRALVAPFSEFLADGEFRMFYIAFLDAALPEEIAKLSALAIFVLRDRHFRRPTDAVALSVAVALGFAGAENVLMMTNAANWQDALTIRALLGVPAHAANGAVMGYFVARAWSPGPGRLGAAAMALLGPVILHGLFDYPVLTLHQAIATGTDMPAGWMIGHASLFALIVTIDAIAAVLAIKWASRADSPHYSMFDLSEAGDRRLGAIVWIAAGSGALICGCFVLIAALSQLLSIGNSLNRLEEFPLYLSAMSIFPLVFGAAMYAEGFAILSRQRKANAVTTAGPAKNR